MCTISQLCVHICAHFLNNPFMWVFVGVQHLTRDSLAEHISAKPGTAASMQQELFPRWRRAEHLAVIDGGCYLFGHTPGLMVWTAAAGHRSCSGACRNKMHCWFFQFDDPYEFEYRMLEPLAEPPRDLRALGETLAAAECETLEGMAVVCVMAEPLLLLVRVPAGYLMEMYIDVFCFEVGLRRALAIDCGLDEDNIRVGSTRHGLLRNDISLWRHGLSEADDIWMEIGV